MFGTILKGNTCHEPAGSPKGGQFCSQQLALDLVGGEGDAPPKRDPATYTESEFIEDLDMAESPKQVEEALSAAGARPILLGGNQLFVVNKFDYVVEWDGKDNYPIYKKKSDFLDEADPSDYFPDDDAEFNSSFWESPTYLYHNTQSEFVDAILRTGIKASSKSRGFTNRFEPDAVYTSTDFEEYEEGSYGSAQFQIDTKAMRRDNYTPVVAREPDIVESELKNRLATAIDAFDYYHEPDSSAGTSYNTVVVRGNIPKKYLTMIKKSEFFQAIFKANPYHDPKTGRFTFGPGGSIADSTAAISPTTSTPKRRRGWKISEKMEAAIRSARDEVLSYNDGKEHSVLIDQEGQPIHAKDGESNFIEFTRDEIKMMAGSVMVHNHPSGGSFSINDLVFAGAADLAAIEAVSSDGSVYRAIPSAKLKKSRMQFYLTQTHDYAESVVSYPIGTMVGMGFISPQDAGILHVDLINSAMADLGFIKYTKSEKAGTARATSIVDSNIKDGIKQTFFDMLAQSLKGVDPATKEYMAKNKVFSDKFIPSSTFA